MLVESLGIMTLVGVLGCVMLLRIDRWLGVTLIVAIVANLSNETTDGLGPG